MLRNFHALCRIKSFPVSAEFAGIETETLFESAVKITQIVEAAAVTDFGNRGRTVQKKLRGVVHTALIDVLNDRTSRLLLV